MEALGDGILEHGSGDCTERYPIIGGIPRLLLGAARGQLIHKHRDWFAAHRDDVALAAGWREGNDDAPIVAGFDDGSIRFRDVGTKDQADVYAQYFDLLPVARLSKDFYRHLSFGTMLNDSLDRFGTHLERRHTRAEITALMHDAGLVDVTFSTSAPFWHGVAKKPKSQVG
jgi:hypothetical protein